MPASSPRSPRYMVSIRAGLRSAGNADWPTDGSEGSVGRYSPLNATCSLLLGSTPVAGLMLASGNSITPVLAIIESDCRNGARVVCECPYRSVYLTTGAYPV